MEKRERRIAVNEKASLRVGDAWIPCGLLNVSDNGFLINCGQALSVGQVVEFRSELSPGKTLVCKVEIRHVSKAGTGTKIVEISEYGARLHELYLQEQYSHILTKRS
jgi:PilZ domain-containing protein